jgi:Na+:H+ antiporter
MESSLSLFDNSYFLVALISVLLILSYLYNIISNKTQIPSVLMLLGSGIVVRLILNQTDVLIPDTKTLLEIFGIIGLILIVLEGSLELKLTKKKLPLIRKSLFAAFFILVASTVSVALVVKIINPEVSFQIAMLNAIPLAVISSAIAIPSVAKLKEQNKEFIIYESTFSDILGIMFFNFILVNSSVSLGSIAWLGLDLTIVTIVSLVFTILLIFFLQNSKKNAIRYSFLIAVIVLLYALGKIFHLSSLLMILFLGLLLNNLNLWIKGKISKRIDSEKISLSINEFHVITFEAAFVVRTFFFFIFGFSLNLNSLLSISVIFVGLIVVAIIYGTRYPYLKYISRTSTNPEAMVAPRGLITILLFYSIPANMSIDTLNDGVLFFVIIATNILMMYVLMRLNKKPIDNDDGNAEEEIKKKNTFTDVNNEESNDNENVFEWNKNEDD